MTRRRAPAAHTHAHRDQPYKCVEIAPNVCVQPVVHSSAPAGMVLNTPEADAYGFHHAGFIVAHDRDGMDWRCEGAVTTDTCGATFSTNTARWTESGSLEGGDLTLSPSILCSPGDCGFHGYIRDGKWVSA